MNINEMKAMVNCRISVIGFLHFNDKVELNELFGKWAKIETQSFKEIAEKAFELYASGLITNKTCSKIITLICENNARFRTESHRYDNGSIFEYSNEQRAYVFIQKGTRKDFNKLVHYID
jgi:hypothetical protein